MREIKFRAFDKEREGEERFAKWVYFIIGPPKDQKEADETVSFGSAWHELLVRQNRLGDFYQFTGLKDKNGKEVYEGDVYRHLTWELDEKSISYDKWQAPEVLENIQDFFEQKGYAEGELMESYDSEHIEVLGNIYENPELLKK